jgi:anion-transporting  ArsA/GET3 family ATPase
MMPTRAGLRAANVATRMFLRTISRVVGGEIVQDAVAFFEAFEGMEQGFRDRAARVTALLEEPGTAFILVSTPRRDAVDEALFFAQRLRQVSGSVQGLVVNRMFPRFGPPPAVDAAGPLQPLVRNLRDLEQIAMREEHYVTMLCRRVPGAALARVQFLSDDVHDLVGLAEVGRHLFSSPSS